MEVSWRNLERNSVCYRHFFGSELVPYYYSSRLVLLLLVDTLQKSLWLHHFKLDWDEIWQDYSRKQVSIDRVGFLIW